MLVRSQASILPSPPWLSSGEFASLLASPGALGEGAEWSVSLSFPNHGWVQWGNMSSGTMVGGGGWSWNSPLGQAGRGPMLLAGRLRGNGQILRIKPTQQETRPDREKSRPGSRYLIFSITWANKPFLFKLVQAELLCHLLKAHLNFYSLSKPFDP